MEQHLYTRLTNHAGLKALIDVRAYPVKLPQDVTYPAVVYEIITRTEFPAMGANADHTRKRITVTGFSDSYSGVKALETQIVAALDRYRGTANGTTIDGCLLENASDVYEDTFESFQMNIDFIVTYR